MPTAKYPLGPIVNITSDKYGGGSGLARMLRKLGPAGAEALRLDTLAQQAEALERVGLARQTIVRPRTDRTWYKTYPVPKSAGLTPRESEQLDALMGKTYALTKPERQLMRRLLKRKSTYKAQERKT